MVLLVLQLVLLVLQLVLLVLVWGKIHRKLGRGLMQHNPGNRKDE
jgi:hypothetical protein